MSADLHRRTIDRFLLDRYLAGDTSNEEAQAVERWLATYPEQARRLQQQTHIRASSNDLEQDWDTLRDRISSVSTRATAPDQDGRLHDAQQLERRRLRDAFPQRIWSTLSWTVATLAIFFAVLTYRASHRPLVPSSQVTTYMTKKGERAEITLADGTHVTLNVASRLDIPRDFGAGRRTVRLRGEAYFRVTSVQRAPFTVDAGTTRTRVLGTEFGVRAYHATNIRVAVRSGKVALDSLVLGARDVATVTSNGKTNIIHEYAGLDNIFGFTVGQLVLKDIPLQDAIEELDRWYNVDIRIADAQLTRLPISVVAMDGSVTDLINILRPILNARVVRNGRMLTLYATK